MRRDADTLFRYATVEFELSRRAFKTGEDWQPHWDRGVSLRRQAEAAAQEEREQQLRETSARHALQRRET